MRVDVLRIKGHTKGNGRYVCEFYALCFLHCMLFHHIISLLACLLSATPRVFFVLLCTVRMDFYVDVRRKCSTINRIGLFCRQFFISVVRQYVVFLYNIPTVHTYEWLGGHCTCTVEKQKNVLRRPLHTTRVPH